jgi:hypothetical protein
MFSRMLLPWFVTFLLVGGGSEARAREATWPRLKIRNLPDSAAVTVNNNKTTPDLLGYCRVSPGLNVVQIETNGIPQFTATFILKAGDEQVVTLDCKEKCSSLDVVTDPLGAGIFLNGIPAGMTPFFNAFLKPGEYSLRIDLKGYEPVNRFIGISKEKPTMLTLNLEPSKTYQDSIRAVRMTSKKSRQYIQRVLFSSLAAACASGGIYFNMNAHRKLSKAQEAADAYDQARSNFSQYRTDYYSNRDGARKALTTRDILYVASGTCVFGFAFSFFF